MLKKHQMLLFLGVICMLLLIECNSPSREHQEKVPVHRTPAPVSSPTPFLGENDRCPTNPEGSGWICTVMAGEGVTVAGFNPSLSTPSGDMLLSITGWGALMHSNLTDTSELVVVRFDPSRQKEYGRVLAGTPLYSMSSGVQDLYYWADLYKLSLPQKFPYRQDDSRFPLSGFISRNADTSAFLESITLHTLS